MQPLLRSLKPFGLCVLLSVVPVPSRALVQDVKVVFLIVMENKDWVDIAGNSDAPYINNVLLPQASHAEQYFTPPDLHPSLPNYIWLEAGTKLGFRHGLPRTRHQS